jgi:hypothetical protein
VPPQGPTTLVELFVWIFDDEDRTRRAIRFLTCVFCGIVVVSGVVCFGLAAIIAVVEGISSARQRYLVPIGTVCGGSTLIALTISVANRVRKKMRKRATGK